MDTAGTRGWRSSLRDRIAAFVRRCSPTRLSRVERSLIGAHGKALTVLVTALQARGHMEADEFADMLAVVSFVVREDSELEGTILAAWAGMIKDSL